MTQRQGLGAQNADDHPLAEWPLASASAPPADDLAEPPTGSEDARPLPPLPDGGLAESMPDWLRTRPAGPPPSTHDDAPGRARLAPPHADRFDGGAGVSAAPRPDTVGPAPFDPTSFLSDDDLPLWIRRLAARERAEAAETWRAASAADERAHAADGRAHAEQPHAIPARSDPCRPLAADSAASSPGSTPAQLMPGERSAPFLGSPTPPPVNAVLVDHGHRTAATEWDEAAAGGREPAPLGRVLAVQVAPPPAPPTSKRSAAAGWPEPSAVPPLERERRVLPMALTIGVIMLAILAYLLGSGALP